MVRTRLARHQGWKDSPAAELREARRPAAVARSKPPSASRGHFTSHLTPQEVVSVLGALLDRRRDLRREVEDIARAMLAQVPQRDVADAVESAVLSVDADNLAERSGRKRWGYVEPSEVSWTLLEEAVAPFFSGMNRLIVLGLEEPAVATCTGIVLGSTAFATTAVTVCSPMLRTFPPRWRGTSWPR
jgi:hypothetical protein